MANIKHRMQSTLHGLYQKGRGMKKKSDPTHQYIHSKITLQTYLAEVERYAKWLKDQGIKMRCSEQEAAVVRTLGTELVRDYGTDKPVVLVGRYTLGENITRYTTADPMQHPLYRFFREHTSWESGDTVKYVETNCNSVLNWSVTAFSEVDDVYGQAAEHLFRYYGFALDMTHSAALHEQAQTYADAHDLPGYPRAGAIVDCGDYVLVNLQ